MKRKSKYKLSRSRVLPHVIALMMLTGANAARQAFHTHEMEPFYDKSADVIVTALKCTAVGSSSCRIDWMMLGSGATPTKLSESFKLPGKIVESAVTTTNSGCTSTLTLQIDPNTPPGSLPSFQCLSRINRQSGSGVVVISSAMQPKQYVEIVPAVSEIFGFLGTKVTIRCPLANDLPPTAIGAMLVHCWHLDSSRENAVNVDSFGLTLSIHNVTNADGGWYQCHPTVIVWIVPTVAVAFGALLFLCCRRRVRRYCCCRRQSISLSEAMPVTDVCHEERNQSAQKSDEILKEIKEIKGDVREILDRGADNASNLVSCASSARMSSCEAAQARRGGGYCKGDVEEGKEALESDV